MIEESDSPYAASIVCVKKQNGEIRLTCDYRSINLMSVDNDYGMSDLNGIDRKSGEGEICVNYSSGVCLLACSHEPGEKIVDKF